MQETIEKPKWWCEKSEEVSLKTKKRTPRPREPLIHKFFFSGPSYNNIIIIDRFMVSNLMMNEC